jgi:hypothetical protein
MKMLPLYVPRFYFSLKNKILINKEYQNSARSNKNLTLCSRAETGRDGMEWETAKINGGLGFLPTKFRVNKFVKKQDTDLPINPPPSPPLTFTNINSGVR